MKKCLYGSALLFFLLGLLTCSQDKGEEIEMLARINDFTLTLDEFQHLLAAEQEMDKDFKINKGAKKEFLEEIIRKELLIQEAKRLGLDRKERFVRAIERHWESTLIRDLIDLKGKEVKDKTLVSEEEIQARYIEMKKTDGKLPPLSALQEKISRDLKENKQSEVLKDWINGLRKRAEIEIDHELLSKN